MNITKDRRLEMIIEVIGVVKRNKESLEAIRHRQRRRGNEKHCQSVNNKKLTNNMEHGYLMLLLLLVCLCLSIIPSSAKASPYIYCRRLARALHWLCALGQFFAFVFVLLMSSPGAVFVLPSLFLSSLLLLSLLPFFSLFTLFILFTLFTLFSLFTFFLHFTLLHTFPFGSSSLPFSPLHFIHSLLAMSL